MPSVHLPLVSAVGWAVNGFGNGNGNGNGDQTGSCGNEDTRVPPHGRGQTSVDAVRDEVPAQRSVPAGVPGPG